MKKLAWTVIILMCVLACVLIYFNRAGKTAAPGQSQEVSSTEEAETAIFFVYYAGTYLSVDKNWKVCANSSGPPAEIPEVSGLEFNRMSYGKKAEPKDKSAFEYAVRVVLDLKKNEISADRIVYESRMITVKIGNLDVKLGKDDKTDEKINDLGDLIDQVYGSSGVLDMQNANANNYGYTFRAN